MISLRSYEFLEDAWQGGVAEWCRAASEHVLLGGRAWMVNVSDGQANWIKRRMLREGVSLFGIQFFNAASLRNELCLRRGIPPAQQGRDTLRFVLRLRALERLTAHPETSAVALHPGACLAALDDLASSGWLGDDSPWRHEILPTALDDWLAGLRRSGDWTPEIDQRLRGGSPLPASEPLALCVFGWDASFWPLFDLLTAAVREAQSALVFAPLPRGSSEGVQMEWFSALEEEFAETFEFCESVGFASAHVAMIHQLEGTDLFGEDPQTTEPELLVGLNVDDAVILTRHFVARWLADQSSRVGADPKIDDPRLVILTPRRNVSAVATLKSLAAAGIDVEDEIGEVPEPSLSVQIQRAILAYHQNGADIENLLVIVELLNEHVAIWDGQGATVLRSVFPLPEEEVRRSLQSAFGEVQHHSARVLRDAFARSRSKSAIPLRQLVDHLDEWPEQIAWPDALARWQHCLEGLGLSVELLEPLWSQLQKLQMAEEVPSNAFLHFLGGILECAPARRSPDGMHRYAKVVLATLEGATGQAWGAAVFLDSNEGAWPLYPEENAFLDDELRGRLNQQRTAYRESPNPPRRGYLLTSSDRAQLEHFRFMEILSNCTGPIAFAGLARDPAEPGKEVYANEWALRCLLETGKPLAEGEKLLDRWHGAIRRTERKVRPLAKAEQEHLQAVFDGRHNADLAFDEYGFNFAALNSTDELPWADAWSASDLETAWNHPATFALRQIFGVALTRTTGRAFARGERSMVGKLVHQWLPIALGNTAEPQEMTTSAWHLALTDGLTSARRSTEEALRRALAKHPGQTLLPDEPLPLWWRGTLQKAHWAAVRCLEALAGVAEASGQAVWLSQNRRFQGDVTTSIGPLRLRASCDVVLSDQPTLDGASCQLIDVRTGTTLAATPSAARLANGEGLNLTALLSLALAEGAHPAQTQIGVIHPDAANLAVLTAEANESGASALEHLARQQRLLNFGQRGNPAGSADDSRDAETLPLATLPIDQNTLESKRARAEGK